MPLAPDEFPDSSIHRMCVRCHKWCNPQEGENYVLPVSPFSISTLFTGVGKPFHFMCFACRRKRVMLRVWIFAILAVLVGLALFLRQFAGA